MTAVARAADGSAAVAGRAAIARCAETFDPAPSLARDPLGVVRAAAVEDREIAAHVASALAYGNAALVCRAARRVLEALGPSPARALAAWAPGDFERADPAFVHRMTRARHVDAFLSALAVVRRDHDALLTAFRAGDRGEPDLAPALSRYVKLLRAASPVLDRGVCYLLVDPERGAAAKRWFLMLRWLVRPDDGVDLGLWSSLGADRLLMPLDTHVVWLSAALGLTTRRTVDLKLSRALTTQLKLIDPRDPLRFDMALCHVGISRGCRHRWDEAICPGCPLVDRCGWLAPRASRRG